MECPENIFASEDPEPDDETLRANISALIEKSLEEQEVTPVPQPPEAPLEREQEGTEASIQEGDDGDTSNNFTEEKLRCPEKVDDQVFDHSKPDGQWQSAQSLLLLGLPETCIQSAQDTLSGDTNQPRSKTEFSPSKKPSRASLKSIDYSELEQEGEQDADEYQVPPKRDQSQIAKDVKGHVSSSKPLSSSMDASIPPKKRPRILAKTDEPTDADKAQNKAKTDDCSKEYNGSRRIPRESLKTDVENLSFYLPEGWLFYANIRQTGGNNSHFDMYYITPPPHLKLRSRQELLKYMERKGLKYDPLRFFRKHDVQPLLDSGKLKYYDSKTVIPPGCDTLILNKVLAFRGPVESKESSENLEKSEQVKDEVKRRWSKTKSSTKSTTPSPFKNEEPSPNTKTMVTSPRTLNRRGRVTKLERFSPDAKKHVNHKPVSRKSRGAKIERISPNAAPTELSNKKSKAVKSELEASTSEVLEASSGLSNRKRADESESAPPKKRGRPRKVVVSKVQASPPQSDFNLEDRVQIRSKPLKRSPYFASTSCEVDKIKGPTGLRRERTISDPPPRSPYNLIQEDLFHDPWQLLISTIFLNSTSGKVAVPLALEFLKRWPDPHVARQAKIDDLLDIIEPLGFGRTRAAIILRFSHEYLTKDWKLPNELYGIGEYGNDSYKIFCLKNAWKKVESDDPMLMMYLNWRRATEHLRKKFHGSSSDVTSVDPDDILSINNSADVTKGNGKLNTKLSISPPKKLRRRTK